APIDVRKVSTLCQHDRFTSIAERGGDRVDLFLGSINVIETLDEKCRRTNVIQVLFDTPTTEIGAQPYLTPRTEQLVHLRPVMPLKLGSQVTRLVLRLK